MTIYVAVNGDNVFPKDIVLYYDTKALTEFRNRIKRVICDIFLRYDVYCRICEDYLIISI